MAQLGHDFLGAAVGLSDSPCVAFEQARAECAMARARFRRDAQVLIPRLGRSAQVWLVFLIERCLGLARLTCPPAVKR